MLARNKEGRGRGEVMRVKLGQAGDGCTQAGNDRLSVDAP